MSKRVFLAAITMLFAASAFAAGQALVNVEDAATVAGGNTTIDVTVSAVPAPGVTDIQGTVTFDPDIVHIDDIQGLNGFAGFFFENINNVAGTATFTAAIVGGGGITAGEMFRLFLTAVGDPGESCFVQIAFTVFRDGQGNDLGVTVDPGTFTIGSTIPPIADFTYGPVNPTIEDVVQFTDQSLDQDGVIVAWNWTFGDGGVSTNQDPAHQYANGGTFTVTLTVTDNEGATDAVSQTVTVVGPSAAFTYSPTSPVSQEMVQFFDQSLSPGSNIASWNWTFGDGGTSGAQNPTHAFAEPGTYRVDLAITTQLGKTVSTYRRITVRNAPPTAAFTFNPAQPKVGQMVTFGAGGSTDIDGNVVVYEWDFNNDGVTDATGSTVTHSFDIVGARPVTLKVTDDDGAFDFATHVVPVQASPPVADFVFAPATPNTGETVSFDASGSTDADGTIILYEWDFNNDGVTDATGMAATHSWPNPGVYPVTLIVSDNDGAFGADTQPVPVQVGGTGGANQAPNAEFDFEPADGPEVNINEVVTFRANGSSDPDGTIAAYEWDFDNDGTYDATGLTVAHVYTTGGAKIVTLRVTDNGGAVGFKTRVVSVDFIRPSAMFDFTPANPKQGEVVVFDASASTDQDGRVDFYEWDFDDDGVADATGKTVTHAFDQGGGVPVTLMVTDNDGVTDFITKTVPVTVNNPPIADFSYSPASPTTDDTVAFGDESIDADGTVDRWLWNFGDGATSNVQSPSHRYTAAGVYNVTLTVTDNEGATDGATQTVTVSAVANTAPVANFTYAPNLPGAGEQVQFTDASTDGQNNIQTWAWDFGDGATSALRNPTHAYAAVGTYAVSLTVTDAGGLSNTTERNVTVGAEGGLAMHSYPNPASAHARVAYTLPTGLTGPILYVYDIRGRLVFERNLDAGGTSYLWDLKDTDGNALPNGVYFCIIRADDEDGRAIVSEPFRLLIDR